MNRLRQKNKGPTDCWASSGMEQWGDAASVLKAGNPTLIDVHWSVACAGIGVILRFVGSQIIGNAI